MIWDYLKTKYERDERIRGMQVLNLIRDFELQKMKEIESIKGYSDRTVLSRELYHSSIMGMQEITRIRRVKKHQGSNGEYTNNKSKTGNKRNPILPISIVVENLIRISNVGEDLTPSAPNATRWGMKLSYAKTKISNMVKRPSRSNEESELDDCNKVGAINDRENKTWILVERLRDGKEEIYVEQPKGFVKEGEEDKHNGASILIISLYVDDLLVTGNHTSLVEKFKLEMMEKKYTKEILKKFKVDECKEIRTPMNQKEKLNKDYGTDMIDQTYFKSTIGCLMYLTTTRPDILTVKQRVELVGFSDSDWEGSIDDMRSTSG
ncbi:hypothetical protein CK203_039324 [Vitis vinifera]|uniref:Reverse transcriptase Ty1/copia-type domain-containing protein n=1 Tax=Vitis vinifera TaxID=29760 RepID=A0A438HGJ9_VITVI|nr:hypothetical protein CK203_039324 [Vitis vinifera]